MNGALAAAGGLTILATLVGCEAAPTDEILAPSRTECAPVAGSPEMVWVEGGEFTMGEDALYPEEGPARAVSVPGFWISRHEITNEQFARFVKDTGYRTIAEREPEHGSLPAGAALEPGLAVFNIPSPQDPRWWRWVTGAQWRSPAGEGDTINGQEAMPVVQMAHQDALAYAGRLGGDLPSEEQWEYAAYCARYRPAARQFQERGLGTNHIGFRVVDNERPGP